MLINHGTRIIHGLREKVNLFFFLSIIIPNTHAFKKNLNFMEIKIKFVHLEKIFLFVTILTKIQIQNHNLAIVMLMMEV